MSRRIPTRRGVEEFRLAPHSNSAGRFDPLRERLSRPGEGTPGGLMPNFYKNLEARLGDRMALDLGGGVTARRDALGGISVSTGNLRERMNAKPAEQPATSESEPQRPAIADPLVGLGVAKSEPAAEPEETPKAPAQFVVPEFPIFKEKP